MPATSPLVQAHFASALARFGPKGPIGSVLTMLSGEEFDRRAWEALLDDTGTRREAWFRAQILDLVLGFVTACLDSGPLTDAQIEATRELKRFLDVQPGEFMSVRRAEIAAVLTEQMDIILEDGQIDSSEDLYQVELQSLFDIGYDDYIALTRRAIERGWLTLQMLARDEPNNPQSRRLVRALEPLYKLACAQSRTLGALY